MLNWEKFSSKYSGKEQKVFEDVAYFLFCEETGQKYGIFAYKDQWGIETEPVVFNGKNIGFQAKYYRKVTDNKNDIEKSIDDAIKKNSSIEQIYLYLNDSFKESTLENEKKPKFQKDIENYASERGVEIIWKVPSQIEFMLHKPENRYLVELFFDEGEPPLDIYQRLHLFNTDLMDYNSTTNNKEYDRPIMDDLLTFIKGEDKDNIALLAGDAGSGKSVLMKQLLVKLEKDRTPVLAIKADYNQFKSINELEHILQCKNGLRKLFEYIINFYGKMVVLIDQIDALSLTLSKDRHDLQIYKSLIDMISPINGLKIIISCREYDLYYETLLQPLSKHHKFKIDLVEEGIVKDVLKDKGADYDSLNPTTKELLRNPLHLSIFCDVYSSDWNADAKSRNDLYDKLWDIRIGKHINGEWHLGNALKAISFRMYEQQELTIESQIFEDKYCQELNYLKSSKLIKIAGNKKIQFFHQSFFDYVYARSYVNEDCHLYEDLKSQHQGFFIRSRVKQVLDYLRAANSSEYIKNVKRILDNPDYKLHIKFLVLSILSFQTNPTNEEKIIFDRIIKNDTLYYNNFIVNLWCGPWLDYLIEKGYIKDLFDTKNEDVLNKLATITYRHGENYQPVIKMLHTAVNSNYDKKYTFIANVLIPMAQMAIPAYNQFFEDTYKKWEPSQLYLYLQKSCSKNPELAIKILRERIENYYEHAKYHAGFKFIPSEGEFYTLAERLQKSVPLAWMNFLMWFVSFVVKKMRMNRFSEKNLFESWALLMYAPHDSIRSAEDFDAYYEELIKALKIKAKEKPSEIEEYLCDCISSNINGLVAISTICYAENIEYFKEDISNLLSNNIYYDGNTWLTYNMVKLMSAAFESLDVDVQNKIYDILYSLHPKWESMVIKDNFKYNHSNIYGQTTYKYMNTIPTRLIEGSKLKSLYREYKRKFGQMENEPPEGVRTHVGYTSLPNKAYENMRIKDWEHSFLTIPSETTITDWDKPTRIGNAEAFQNYVQKDWEKFADLIRNISKDKKFDLIYSYYACEGLQKGKANPLFVVEVIENIIERGESCEAWFMKFLNTIEYVISENVMTDKIFEYLYQIAIDKKYEDQNEDIQFENCKEINGFSYGIRGLVATELIMCYECKKYDDKIFDALFKIAEDGNMSTRVAVLVRMAYLQNVDCDRNLNLYLALQRPNMPLLKSIPMGDQNPLLYLIVSKFKVLIPYFKSIMDLPVAGGPLKTTLLIAWLRGYDGSEEILREALKKNLYGIDVAYQQATEVLKVERLRDKAYQFIMECFDYDDEKLGNTVGIYFNTVVDNLNGDDIKTNKFIDQFVDSKLGRYQRRELYNYLKGVAGQYPEKTLQRLKNLHENTSLEPDSFYRANDIFEIIVSAYNSIYRFDKQDTLLEFAIGLFDEFLKKGKLGLNAFRFLDDLEN